MPNASAGELDKTQLRTSVIILFDLSESFIPLAKPDSTALLAISDAIQRASMVAWKTPIYLYWIGIGDPELPAIEPCGPAKTFEPSMLGIAPARPNVLSTSKGLAAWLGGCRRRLLAPPGSPFAYTDISGAVAHAADIAHGVGGDGFLLIYSDLLEDLPKHVAPIVFALHGERVLLLYRDSLRRPTSPDSLRERVARWSTRLEAAGASTVNAVPIFGLHSALVLPYLIRPNTK